MTKQVNMNPGESVTGPGGVVMTSVGNPWTVADSLADDLVQREKATPVGWSRSATPALLTPAQSAAVMAQCGTKQRLTINRNNADFFPLGDCTSAAFWTDFNVGAVTGATFAVDTSVLWDGAPTIRVDIPAGAPSGVIRLGTTGASVVPPAGWDGSRAVLAVRANNLAAFPGVVGYWGDATFASFFVTNAASVANFPERYWRAGDWMVHQVDTPAQHTARGTGTPAYWSTGAGAPTWSDASNNPRRVRVTLSYTSQAQPVSIWLGAFGIVGKRRPKVVLTLDDGYASWATWFVPLCKFYGLPVSLGIIKGLVGSAGYLTQAQVQALVNDTSGLVSVHPHATVHQPYDQGTPTGGKLSLTQYIADVNQCRDWLLGLGADPAMMKHHPIVQSLSDANLIDALAANGYLSARMGATGTYTSMPDQLLRLLPRVALCYYGGAVMDAPHDVNASGVMTKVNLAATLQETIFIEGHDFTGLGTTPPSWPQSEAASLLQQLAAGRDAGTWDVYSWDGWYDAVTRTA